jgi:hypothetical protein
MGNGLGVLGRRYGMQDARFRIQDSGYKIRDKGLKIERSAILAAKTYMRLRQLTGRGCKRILT